MPKKFLVFNPRETRLGPQTIEPNGIWGFCRHVDHSESITNLYLKGSDEPLEVQHPYEVIAKALDANLVEVVNPKKK